MKAMGSARLLAGLATTFWVCVGIRLVLLGAQSALRLHQKWEWLILLLLVSLIAYFKGIVLFGKLAKQNLFRLSRMEEPIPLYRVFSVKTYAMIAFFAPLGILLGQFLEDPLFHASILLSVGTALLLGGVQYAYHWKKYF
ncbi:MAG: hypothetical protein CSA81_08375 [Acidobacteria bacterium]|nr:MAG: hypothetical protein CSA81_08375 [Acidobacteriota bacterium]PIE89740.1 MAG: hypothetical protein CR997_09910 [Acidobacteriota bacterium]